MTILLNQSGDQALNLELCSHIYVGEDNYIKAVVADGQKMLRMGSYPDYDCAAQALMEVLQMLRKGTTMAQLPTAEVVRERVVNRRDPAPNKFAANGKKPTRHGGS